MKCELCRAESKSSICSRCRALTSSPAADARARQKRLFLMTLAGNAMLGAGVIVAAVISGSMAHRAPAPAPKPVSTLVAAAPTATPAPVVTAAPTPAAKAKATATPKQSAKKAGSSKIAKR